MSRRRKLILLSVAAILAALFLWRFVLWRFVLNNVAVYGSISLTPGTTVTQDFWANYAGFYTLEIEAQRKFPHAELQCLLGINDWLGVKNCTETRLKYSWALSCDAGKAQYSGTSEKILGGAYATDWIATEFGGFQAKRWERCQLKINFIDASPLLSQTNPRLRIYTELF